MLWLPTYLAEVGVAYTPDWESLANALTRVVATGVAEPQARTEICQALADRKIAIRSLIRQDAPDVGGKILASGNIEVPPHLDPADLDWVKSCPFRPWNTGPDMRNPTDRYFAIWRWTLRSIELLELSTADVCAVLCNDPARADPARQGGVRDKAKERRGPKPGALRRYEADDRALFDELERIMREEKMSVSAAARRLADSSRVSGVGGPASRAKRLAALYRQDRGEFSAR